MLIFKKAFDTVEHTFLKSKLLAAEISGKFHDWLISYISDRSQYVLINGRRSGLQIVDIGVPQESLLGPRLFEVYVNDLPNATPIGYIHMFADDATMYYCSKEVEETVDILNMMLLDFHQWYERNKLTVHSGKTVAILISNRPFVGPMRPLRFGNSFIHFTSKITCLVVEIDCKLNWKSQIEQVAKKFRGKL